MRELDAICADLARELEGHIDGLTEAAFDYWGDRLPDWLREPPLWEMLRDAARESILVEVRTLRSGGALPESCPPPDAWGARESAVGGHPLSLLLDGYRAGHRAQWNAWSELVEQRDLEPELASAARQRASDFFFAYAGRLSSLVTEEYARERDRRRGTEQRRLEIVRALLDGEVEATDTTLLDHPVEGWHIGLLGSGVELKDALAASARGLDCRLLVIDVYEDPWWAWLGRSRPIGEGAWASIVALGERPGARLGIGTEQAGGAGFRESHRQAAAAFQAARAEQPVVGYPEVAVEDLASRDAEAARAFLAAELEPMAGDDRRSRGLRETLATYFECGQNARATAARLGIHHQTVAQRLDAIEQRIGHPVAARQVELELALRLRRYLQ